MSELKFSCPACGQTLQADTAHQGIQIQCPSCQAPIIVPAQAPEPAAPRANPITNPPVQAFKTCGLAKASLILSLTSLVIGPCGFIPSIICGHLARGRMRANPRLAGKGAATAGLVLGYGFLVLSVALVAIVSTVVLKTAAQLQQQTKQALVQEAGGAAPVATMSKGFSGVDDAWKTNLTAVSIPSAPVTGRIHGQRFVCDRAEVSPADKPLFLMLRQGEGLQGDIKITILIGDGQGVEARTLDLLTTADIPGNLDYRVEVLRRENGRYVSKHYSRIQDGFVMRLECQPRVGDRIKGRIYLCLGDEERSYVAGAFEARLR